MPPSARVALLLVVACGLLGSHPARSWAQEASPSAPAPTFSRDVAPILYKHCTTCHRPGEAAPMSLLTFEEARPWARAIRDRVQNGTMPPWHADPAHGKFVNDRRLTMQEKEVLSRWVAGGAPAGDAKDLPAKPVYARGWTIGEPDAIIPMPTPYAVPAQGEIPYQYFEASTNFTEDRWVQAVEIRPGDRSVVHHVLVYARAPETTPRTPVFRARNPPGPMSPQMKQQLAEALARGGQSNESQGARRGPLMAQTAPGTPATVFKPGTALLVKAGTVLTFQIHYTTNGKATTDTTSLGFVFAKQPPAAEVRAAAMINARFMIPPGAADHPVESALEFLEDVTIYSLVPHTHLRGKSWEHRLVYPDGREETLLAVPKYDFNWQTEYIFAEPLRVPKGAVLKAVAHYDNSTANKANPDATQPVYWGDQTWEEMQYTAISFSVDKDNRSTVQQKH
jgi:hypothetical protein